MPTPVLDNRQLGPDTARLNLLTNGGFEISQRGTPAWTADTNFPADRWQIRQQNTSTISVNQIASAIGSQGKSLQLAYTHVAGGAWDLRQTFNLSTESQQLQGKTLTLRFTARSNVVGTVRAFAYDTVTGYTYGAYNTQTSSGETLAMTFTVAAAATQLVVGVQMNVATCTVEVNDAMLVVGSQPADYAPLHPADEMTRCLRYYERVLSGGVASPFGIGQALAPGTVYGMLTCLRGYYAGSPSMTVSTATDFMCWDAGTGNHAFTAMNLYAQTYGGRSIMCSGTGAAGLTSGSASPLLFANGSAWLALEYNP